MGRFSGGGGYGHYCKYHNYLGGWYEIGWKYDKYYRNDRLRYPRLMTRQTGEAGARRFCKKWGIKFPESEERNG